MDLYEKKYKEALAHAREIHRNEEGKRRDMEFIFPELSESEDEKVRKELISHLQHEYVVKKNVSDVEYDKWIAWLENIPVTIDHEKREGFHLGYKAGFEKQGNKNNILIWHNVSEDPEEMQELLLEWESEDATWHEVGFYHQNDKTYWDGERKIDNVTRWCYVEELLEKQDKQEKDILEDAILDGNEDGLIAETIRYKNEKQGEQKPENICSGCINKRIEQRSSWSEDDTSIAVNNPEAYRIGFADGEAHAKEEIATACSEEDERNLQGIIDEIDANKNGAPDYDLATYDRYLSWLKSLRPQNTWKPSDEQIGCLSDAIEHYNSLGYPASKLKELLNDLKKLKEGKK